MAAFMGKDVKKLKAKGGGKVSSFFNPRTPLSIPFFESQPISDPENEVAN